MVDIKIGDYVRLDCNLNIESGAGSIRIPMGMGGRVISLTESDAQISFADLGTLKIYQFTIPRRIIAEVYGNVFED